MRIALSLTALLLATGAAPADQKPAAEASVCRDRIEQVRAERGLPKLDRDTATGDEALLIAAVDHRIGGCSVMVMRGDTTDVRPLPAPREGPLLRKIPGQ